MVQSAHQGMAEMLFLSHPLIEENLLVENLIDYIIGPDAIIGMVAIAPGARDSSSETAMGLGSDLQTNITGAKPPCEPMHSFANGLGIVPINMHLCPSDLSRACQSRKQSGGCSLRSVGFARQKVVDPSRDEHWLMVDSLARTEFPRALSRGAGICPNRWFRIHEASWKECWRTRLVDSQLWVLIPSLVASEISSGWHRGGVGYDTLFCRTEQRSLKQALELYPGFQRTVLE